MLKFESNIFVIFSYFDEVFGPQVLEIFPYTHSAYLSDIVKILNTLMDVSSATEDDSWRFLYGDDLFASQNIRITLLNPEARGGLSDLMISVVLAPPHPQHIAAMAHDWNNAFQLQHLLEDQIYFDKALPQFKDEDLISEIMTSAHGEIVERMQFFVELLEPGVHTIS